jgi:hypothetical protein
VLDFGVGLLDDVAEDDPESLEPEDEDVDALDVLLSDFADESDLPVLSDFSDFSDFPASSLFAAFSPDALSALAAAT